MSLHNVQVQRALSGELAVTRVAFVVSRVKMHSLMMDQLSLARIDIWTEDTVVDVIPMNLLVPQQIGIIAKSSVTIWSCTWIVIVS